MTASSSTARTLVTGATGFVGQQLLPHLNQPVICSRNRTRALEQVGRDVSEVIQWDPIGEPLAIPNGSPKINRVVNLMGESIAEGRWNEAKKKRIRDSRVLGTRRLVDGLIAANELPEVMVSASAIGYYGDSGEDIVDENHASGSGFLTEVCQQWEAEALRLQEHGVRVVCLRIGMVLGEGGGAVKELKPIFKWGLGGRLGSGQQWMAWIHVADLVGLILHCLNSDTIQGPVNATAPNPVRNKTFTKAMAAAVGRPAILPAPKFGVRMILGEFANSLFFSQRIIPRAAQQDGYQFQFPDIAPALASIL